MPIIYPDLRLDYKVATHPILRRCGLDPASASAPFVATLVDVTGIIIYFSVAKLILTGTLL
jgi:magnesium transporter